MLDSLLSLTSFFLLLFLWMPVLKAPDINTVFEKLNGLISDFWWKTRQLGNFFFTFTIVHQTFVWSEFYSTVQHRSYQIYLKKIFFKAPFIAELTGDKQCVILVILHCVNCIYFCSIGLFLAFSSVSLFTWSQQSWCTAGSIEMSALWPSFQLVQSWKEGFFFF